MKIFEINFYKKKYITDVLGDTMPMFIYIEKYAKQLKVKVDVQRVDGFGYKTMVIRCTSDIKATLFYLCISEYLN